MRDHPQSPWNADPFPGPFTVPTMLTPQEINYLHWLARQHCRGLGRIVELGCFLGGSTMALATGLKANIHGARRLGPMLTYDSFEMDGVAAAMPMHTYRAGERFRPLFDIHLRDHLADVEVREGWVPRDLPVEDEAEFYPEQAPVEVLFIDVAKDWLVHSTILRCFGRHLIPGKSVVVQQDYKYYFGHWIPLHMHQLRECFEILDDVPLSATMSFRYRGGLEERLGDLLRPGDIAPADIPAVWDEIEEFWMRAGSLAASATTRMSRAMHLASAGLFVEATEALASFHAWLGKHDVGAFRGSLLVQLDHALGHIRNVAVRRDPAVGAEVAGRADELEKRMAGVGAGDGSGADVENRLRRALCRQIALRCSAMGASRIALYGAGRHTADLLGAGWPGGETGVDVVAIVDDFARTPRIRGIPVVTPRDLSEDVDAIVISSDGFEDVLAEAAERSLGRRGVPIVRIYGPGPVECAAG